MTKLIHAFDKNWRIQRQIQRAADSTPHAKEENNDGRSRVQKQGREETQRQCNIQRTPHTIHPE